jgi:polyhydroxyalkanoate synthase subunit PhaC
MLDDGRFASARELAEAEQVGHSYVGQSLFVLGCVPGAGILLQLWNWIVRRVQTSGAAAAGRTPMFAFMDTLRRAQGEALGRLGCGPAECGYHVLASGPNWLLRDYAGPDARPSLLIIATPIKRPYLWDLAPPVSAVRYCMRHHLRVYLLEWMPPSAGDGKAGLTEYADRAIGEAVARISQEPGCSQPFLMGHSLGGTFAAIFGALDPQSVRGLVLLGAPLCFQPGTSRFRDAIVAIAPSFVSETSIVPGSFLSQLSALADPETFVLSRLFDATFSSADPLAWDIHMRVERWALDEVPLSGKLVHEILQWLYRENRFCRGTLPVRERTVGPSDLRLQMLAVVNPVDEIAPPASVIPFIDAMPGQDVRVLEYPGEIGVGLQHLGILVGRRAYTHVWPEIISWLRARC